jgi:hypothetical protein
VRGMLAKRRVQWCLEYKNDLERVNHKFWTRREADATNPADPADTAFLLDAFARYGLGGRADSAKEAVELRMQNDELFAGLVHLRGAFKFQSNRIKALEHFSRSKEARARFFEGLIFFSGQWWSRACWKSCSLVPASSCRCVG